MIIIEKDEKGAMVQFPYCHYRRNYVARITGTDEKFGLARQFCGQKVNMSGSGKNGSIEVYIGIGEIVEYRDGNIYKGENEKTYFGFSPEKGIQELSTLEARRLAEVKNGE